MSSIISGRGQKILYIMLGIGVIGFAAGLFMKDARLWPSFLLNAFFFLTLSLGATVFISINRVANAGWDTAIRRVPEAMMSYLPLASITMLVLFFGRKALYEGTYVTFFHGNKPMTFKNVWLSTPFFFSRMVVFLGLWMVLAWLIRRESRRQDLDGNLEHTRKGKRYAAIFLGVFGLSFTFASFDWLMSIEPLFYSTIYAFYVISGLLLGGFASITVLVILLRRRGLLPGVNDKHLQNLGKLVFGFSTFWAYIWLCQYILIYYANLPEETIYYLRRMHTPGWNVLFWGTIFLNWLIPFSLLLSRGAKRSEGWLLLSCGVVLVGHWLDVYVMIFPAFDHSALVGFVDVAILIGFVSLFLQSFLAGLGNAALSPGRDPYLEESLWQEPRDVPSGLAWTPAMKRALALATLGFAVTCAVWSAIGALAPDFRVLYQLSPGQTTALVAIPLLLAAIARFPAGVLADKYGGRVVLGVLLLFCGLAALAATFARSYSLLLICAILVGFAGTGFTVGAAFVSRWFPEEQQGIALGTFGVGNAGLSIAVGLAALFSNWRIPFWLLSIVAVAFGGLFLILATDAPVTNGRGRLHESVRLVWREPICWLLGLFYFLTFGGFVALGIYLPTLLTNIFGLTPTDAGLRVTGFVLLAVMMRPVGGWLADRYGGVFVLMLAFAMVGVLSLGLTSSAIFVFTIGALGTAVALGLGNGAVFKLVPQNFPQKIGAATGLVSALGGLGGLFPPLILVLIKNSTGTYTLGFLLLALFAFGCLGLNYLVFVAPARKNFSYQT